MMSPRYNESCAVCESSMTGARLGGDCPVCGYRPGATFQTIRRSNASGTALLLVGVALFLTSVAGKPVGNWEPLVIMALSLCVLATWRVLASPMRKAVLWEGGLILIGRHRRPESLKWDTVKRIHLDKNGERIEFSGPLDEDLLTLEFAFFGSRGRAERFVVEAHRWRNSDPRDDAT